MTEYRHSAHAVFDLKYHVVWCTKYRYKILRGRVAERARDLIRQTCESRDVVIVREQYRRIMCICCCQRRRSCRRQSWCSTSRGGQAANCRRSFRNCESGIGGNTCGHADTSVRRWGRSMRQRSKPTSKVKRGTKTNKALKLPRPSSLKPASSRSSLQAALAATSDFQS